MKACVLHAVGDLRYEDAPDPVRKPGEVLVDIKASGICGSDIPRVFAKGTYSFPTIPGHEFGGVIAAADDPLIIGKKCAVFPLVPCRVCPNCEVGRYVQCDNYDYFGSRRDGGFAEQISVPRWNIVIAPDNLGFEEIAMTEPCAVALHSLQKAELRVGDRICVFGAGPIGLTIGKWARLKGASDITLIDVAEAKTAFAEKLGFQTKIDGVYDIVVECAGAGASFENAVKAAKTSGAVVLTGNPSGIMALTQTTYQDILRKELILKGTWNSGYNMSENDWSTALAHMERLDLQPLVSHRYGFSQCREAFDMIKAGKEFSNKVLFINGI